MESSLEWYTRNHGEDFPLVQVVLNNLAQVYKDLGEHDLALDVLARALEAKRTLYGEESRPVAIGYHNLASRVQKLAAALAEIDSPTTD